MTAYLLVALGGAIGASARFGVARLVSRLIENPAFPLHTLFVNAAGCFFIGLLGYGFGVSWLNKPGAEPMRLLLVVGLLGGMTTYSTFSLETLELIRAGRLWSAMGYIALTNALALVGVFAGFMVGEAFIADAPA